MLELKKTWVRSLGQDDPLEEGMATHSSILVWKIPWTEESDRLQSMGLQRVGHSWAISLHFTSTILKVLNFWNIVFSTLSYCYVFILEWKGFQNFCCSVSQSCPALCDLMDCSTTGIPVPHDILEFAQVHVHCVGNAVQPSHPLMLYSPSALSLSQHQGLFQWVSRSYQVTTILELQL